MQTPVLVARPRAEHERVKTSPDLANTTATRVRCAEDERVKTSPILLEPIEHLTTHPTSFSFVDTTKEIIMNAHAQNQNAARPKNYASALDVPSDVLTHEIIGAGIEVHRHLGPGLLEAPYERALCFELARRGIPFRSQVPIPLTFKGDNVGDYYADLIVADRVLIEIKSVVALGNAHLAQILSYLATTKLRLGLLLNFNVPVLVRGGVKRVVR